MKDKYLIFLIFTWLIALSLGTIWVQREQIEFDKTVVNYLKEMP